jgi:hypothetical protein
LVLAEDVAHSDRLSPLLVGRERVAFNAELEAVAGEQALLAFDVLGTAEMPRAEPPSNAQR